jgi:hypothetical protein
MERRYTITTERVVAERALGRTRDEHCVDWAIGLLEQGASGHYLQMLASLSPPFNGFEVDRLLERTLREVGASELAREDAVYVYARERLLSLLAGTEGMAATLDALGSLYRDEDHAPLLKDLYLLNLAYQDLYTIGESWYWPGATKENIQSIVLERAREFVESKPWRLERFAPATASQKDGRRPLRGAAQKIRSFLTRVRAVFRHSRDPGQIGRR